MNDAQTHYGKLLAAHKQHLTYEKNTKSDMRIEYISQDKGFTVIIAAK